MSVDGVCLPDIGVRGLPKPAPAPPEKALVHAAAIESMENVRPDGEASYLAMVRAEKDDCGGQPAKQQRGWRSAVRRPEDS
jgi:hypothetical protein